MNMAPVSDIDTLLPNDEPEDPPGIVEARLHEPPVFANTYAAFAFSEPTKAYPLLPELLAMDTELGSARTV
jgi:hypothetical protein